MCATPVNIGTSVLRTLHRIHHQLADLKSRLDRGPKQIRATDANAKHHEELLAKAKAESKTMRMAADAKQLQLKSGEDKVKELQRKLNAASSNREYQALLEQIAADEMANSVMADEILESFEKVDEFQKHVAESESALAAAKQRVTQVQADVAQRTPILQADIDRLEAELRESEQTLPDDVREMYLRIVRGMGEDAMAMVEDQYCNGCHQQIPLNLLNQIMLGQPVFCKTCGRILYLPEEKVKRGSDE